MVSSSSHSSAATMVYCCSAEEIYALWPMSASKVMIPKQRAAILNTFIEDSLAATDIKDRSVIAVNDAMTERFDLYSAESVANRIYKKYGIKVSRESIRFVEDADHPGAWFDPCVEAPKIGRMTLELERIR